MALLGLTPEALMGTPDWEDLSPSDRSYIVDQWAIEHKAASPDASDEEMRQFNQMVDQFREAAAPSMMERAGSFVGGVAQSIPQSMAAMAMTLPTYSAEAGGIIGQAMTGASTGDMMREAPLTTRTMLAAPQTARNIGTWAQRQIPGDKAREFDRMNAKLADLRTTLLDGPDDPKAVKALAQQVAVAAAGYNGDDPTQYLYAGMADGLDRPDNFAEAVKEERRPRVVNDYGLRDADLRGMRTIHADPENLALAAAFRETRNPAYFEELANRLTMPDGTLRRSAMIYANEVPGQEEYETAWGDLAPMRYVRGAVFNQAESPIDTALSLVGVGGLFRGVKAAASGPLTLGKIGRGALKSTAVEGTSGAASAIGADSTASGGEILEQAAAEVLGEAGAAGGGFLMQRGMQEMMRGRRTAPATDAGGEGGWLPEAPEAAPAAPPFSPDTEETPYVDPGTAAAGIDLPTGPGTIDPSLLPEATVEESWVVADDLTPPTPADPMGTVPETPMALGEQKRRVAQGNQAGMLVPGVRADALPAELLPGENDPLVVTDTPDGAVIHGLDVSREEIMAAHADGSLMQQLGYATSEKPVTPDATVVTVRTPEGTEVSAEGVAPRDVPAAIAAAAAKADPQDVVSLESPQEVVERRAQAFQDPMAFTSQPDVAGDVIADFGIQPRPAPVGMTEGVPSVNQAMAAAAGPAPAVGPAAAAPTTVQDLASSPVRAARNVDLAGFRDRVRAEAAAAAQQEQPVAEVMAEGVPTLEEAMATAPKPKRETKAQRQARLQAEEKARRDAEYAAQAERSRRARKGAGLPPHPLGGRDILDDIIDAGRIDLPKGKKRQSGDQDDTSRLAKRLPPRYMEIFGKPGRRLDQMAQDLYDAGLLPDAYPTTLTDAIDKAVTERMGARKQLQKVQADEKRMERQAMAFGKEVVDPKPSVQADRVQTSVEELVEGDELRVAGEEFTVVERDYNNGAALLEDGPKFGTQRVYEGTVLHVDEHLKTGQGNEAANLQAALAAWDMEMERPDSDFELDTQTPFDVVADRQAESDREKARAARQALEDRQRAPLKGDSSNVGQGALFDEDADLFSGPSAQSRAERIENWADKTIAESRKRFNTGIDPEVMAAYAVKATAIVARGVRDFALFSAEMVRQFGETVRPHLDKLFAQATGKTEADFRTVSAAGQTVESLPPGYDINLFGIRMQADNRLRESWREKFAPALYQTFTEEGLVQDVKQWIADNGGLVGATSLFLDEASGLKDFERNALGQQLAIAWDLRAVRMERRGDTQGVHQAEAALESVSRTLEVQGTKAGQALRAFGLWSKLSPRGLVRATQRRVDTAREEHLGTATGADPAKLVEAVNTAAQPLPSDNQLQTEWDAMLSNTPEALRRKLADLLKQMIPQATDYRKRIEETIVRAGLGMREQLTQDGAENLVRQWFQLMAGPRDRPGPLSAFDRATQELLRQTMREAAARAGLVAENVSVQPDAIDRIVMGMSNDPLKMDKLRAAEEIMQERLAGSPDLRAAWEEATVAMAEQIAGPALLRRTLRAALRGMNPDWANAFNTGRPMAQAADGIRAAAVGQVMAQVQARLGPAVNQNPQLLPGLEAELNASFNELAAERYASWLVAREAQVNRARVAEARRRFLEALRPGNMTQARIDRLDALLQADALGADPDARVANPLTKLLGEHMKAPVPDFVAKARALGVMPEIAQDYDQAVKYHRDKAERAARERAIQSLLKSLAPKPARVVGPRVPAVVAALQKAGKLGVATRGDFLDAWADAFELPRMTPELAGEIRQLVSAVDATPRGSWLRQRAMANLMSRLALHEGMKSADILTSFWYANILSGIGTQLVNITGNASHLFLKSVQHILTTNPKHLMPYLQGMLSGAKQGIQQGAMAFKDGDPVLRSEEKWEQTDVLEMLWSDNPRTLGGLIAKYGAASWGRYVFRALTAMDSFFYTTAKEGRAWVDVSRSMAKGMSLEQALGYDTASWTAAQAEAASDLAAAGITVPSTKQVDRRAYEILEARRGADVLSDSRRFGAKTTFNYEPEGTLGAMSQLLNRFIVMVPPFRIVVPFTKIVANLTDTALDWTPYGIVRGVMGRHMFNHKDKRFTNQERQERIVSGALSLVAGAALYSLAKGNEDQDDESVPFMIYGTGPRDKAARDQMPEGWRPMTIKVGGRYISYSETPLNLLLGAIGGAMDLRRYGSRKDSDEPFARAQALLLGMGNGVLRSGMLSGVAQLFDTVRGQAKLSAFPSRTASGLIPMQGLMRNVAEVIDPVKLDTGTFAGTLMQNVPILRGQGTPLLNEFGEPVRMPGPWLLSRLVTANKQSDPDAVWLARNKITLPGFERDIVVGTFLRPQEKGYLRATGGPLEADRLKRAENAARVEAGYLTPEERIDYIKRSGAMRRQAVRMIRQQTAGRNIEPKFIENMVQNRVGAANRIAMRQVLGLQPK